LKTSNELAAWFSVGAEAPVPNRAQRTRRYSKVLCRDNRSAAKRRLSEDEDLTLVKGRCAGGIPALVTCRGPGPSWRRCNRGGWRGWGRRTSAAISPGKGPSPRRPENISASRRLGASAGLRVRFPALTALAGQEEQSDDGPARGRAGARVSP